MARGGESADPLERLVEQGPAPVYLIDGEERLLVDEAVQLIKRHGLSKQARDFNLDVFSGKDVKLERVIEAALTLPAFAPRRLVVVEGADKLELEGSERLLAYLAQPSPTTVLVFVGEKFDARTKVYKAFQKHGVVLRYAHPRAREMPDFIRRRAQRTKVAIEEAGCRALANAAGTDASYAISALEILALYVGPGSGRSITADDVARVVQSAREESVFALVDAVGQRDYATAFSGLHSMFAVQREAPLRVLAMVARQWRNLTAARSLLDLGAARPELEAALGVPPFVVEGLLAQARKQPALAFARGLTEVAEADRQLKGGKLDAVRVMERLVLALMRPR